MKISFRIENQFPIFSVELEPEYNGDDLWYIKNKGIFGQTKWFYTIGAAYKIF